jgi:hypothetical protein
MLSLNGTTKHIREWAKDAGMKTTTLYARLQHGITLEDALAIPLYEAKYVQH